MITGISVVVMAEQQTGVDEFNAPIFGWVDEATVDNVLFAPASTDQLRGSTRPDGVSVEVRLDFPKDYTGSLRGKRVRVGLREWAVVGDPQPFLDHLTPGDWNRPVELTVAEG